MWFLMILCISALIAIIFGLGFADAASKAPAARQRGLMNRAWLWVGAAVAATMIAFALHILTPTS